MNQFLGQYQEYQVPVYIHNIQYYREKQQPTRNMDRHSAEMPLSPIPGNTVQRRRKISKTVDIPSKFTTH